MFTQLSSEWTKRASEAEWKLCLYNASVTQIIRLLLNSISRIKCTFPILFQLKNIILIIWCDDIF